MSPFRAAGLGLLLLGTITHCLFFPNTLAANPIGEQSQPTSRPNIVILLCDDLGIGDVQSFNPAGKIQTPNIDRLAYHGLRCTNAHSSSAVCTPTRYALLTGRYNWRSRLQRGVLGGLSPRLIEPEVMTLASFLKQQGYQTGCIGKWHLGMNWPQKEVTEFGDDIEKGSAGWKVDFTKPVSDGPNAVGFDRYFGISASLDMIPYTYIQDDHVTEVPTVDVSHPMTLGRNPQRTTRRGPGTPDFDPADVLPDLTDQAIQWIRQWHQQSPDQPFFLYLPFASPHTPVAPNPLWQGASGLNPYADFVMETDHAVGRIDQVLNELKLTDNTLLIFTSDNGCSPEADFPELAQKGHDPSRGYRGTKADIFEGGHRVPMIVRWPGHVTANAQTDQLIGLQDTFATVADALGVALPEEAAVDSVSWWPVADTNRPVSDNAVLRTSLVHHSINGSFAIRKGPWKLCFCPDSGGWSAPRPNSPASKDLPPLQLFHLETDPAEKTNVWQDHPDVVLALTDEMESLIQMGRTSAGPQLSNTVPVQWKRPQIQSP